MSVIRWMYLLALFPAVVLFASMAGCSDADKSRPADVGGFNYTSYYIAQFGITNEGQNLSAGGPNIFPKKAEKERAEGGFVCCIGIPGRWRPGIKLVVRWKVDKIQDGKTPSQWYVASTDLPPYGPNTYGFWVHFLPGDRIRVQVQDQPTWPDKPDEHDRYIVQGMLDAERNQPETQQ